MDAKFIQVNWETRKKVLLSNLSIFRKKEIHTDVTLSCDGENFAAHRLILSLCSGYFAKAFQTSKGFSVCPSLVLVCGIKSSILDSILHFVYEGTATINSDDLADLLKAGLTLEIPGLMEIGKNYTDNVFHAIKPIDDSNVVKSANYLSKKYPFLTVNSHKESKNTPSSKSQNESNSVLNAKLLHEYDLTQSSDTEIEAGPITTDSLMRMSSESECEQDFEGWETELRAKKQGSTKGCKRNQVCRICTKSFFKAESLKIHLENHRRNKHNFACKFCTKDFNNERLYRSHVRKHGAVKGIGMSGQAAVATQRSVRAAASSYRRSLPFSLKLNPPSSLRSVSGISTPGSLQSRVKSPSSRRSSLESFTPSYHVPKTYITNKLRRSERVQDTTAFGAVDLKQNAVTPVSKSEPPSTATGRMNSNNNIGKLKVQNN